MMRRLSQWIVTVAVCATCALPALAQESGTLKLTPDL